MSLEDGVFERCYSLQSAVLPKNLKQIGNKAFAECYGLKSVYIPNSLFSIGSGAFYNCTALESVEFDGSDESFAIIILNSGGGNEPLINAYGGGKK
jgi:hypothetical protein